MIDLTDTRLVHYKILASIVVIAAGCVLAFLGFDSTVTFITGAASGYFVRTMFGEENSE